jgi:hypothetical protein
VRFHEIYDSPDYRERIMDHRADTVAARAFPGRSIRPLPVLFDIVDDFRRETTLAVTPDLVNLQTLDDHVLVPRPYGPRMRPDAAVSLLDGVLRRFGHGVAPPTLDQLDRAGLIGTVHWTREHEYCFRSAIGWRPSAWDGDDKVIAMKMDRYYGGAGGENTAMDNFPGSFDHVHRGDPWLNHPVREEDTLHTIARAFRDGFDEFKNSPVDYAKGDTADNRSREKAVEDGLVAIEDRIRNANPGVFASDGSLAVKDWTPVRIPEDTVDLFEAYTWAVLTPSGATPHFVDSWYYHTHSGGIHCGTNALRRVDGR